MFWSSSEHACNAERINKLVACLWVCNISQIVQLLRSCFGELHFVIGCIDLLGLFKRQNGANNLSSSRDDVLRRYRDVERDHNSSIHYDTLERFCRTYLLTLYVSDECVAYRTSKYHPNRNLTPKTCRLSSSSPCSLWQKENIMSLSEDLQQVFRHHLLRETIKAW